MLSQAQPAHIRFSGKGPFLSGWALGSWVTWGESVRSWDQSRWVAGVRGGEERHMVGQSGMGKPEVTRESWLDL